MVPGGGSPMGGEFGQSVAGAEKRLFRFVDTAVKPGESYRYRVRFALRKCPWTHVMQDPKPFELSAMQPWRRAIRITWRLTLRL